MGHRPNNLRTLTFEDKVKVAWAYYVEHVPQRTLASIFGVNSGRINEVCTTVRKVLEEEKTDEPQ